jgi:hypothetical protein
MKTPQFNGTVTPCHLQLSDIHFRNSVVIWKTDLYSQFRWGVHHFKNTYSPITLANISSINVVFIFRCSSSTSNPVYERHVDSLALVFSLASRSDGLQWCTFFKTDKILTQRFPGKKKILASGRQCHTKGWKMDGKGQKKTIFFHCTCPNAVNTLYNCTCSARQSRTTSLELMNIMGQKVQCQVLTSFQGVHMFPWPGTQL